MSNDTSNKRKLEEENLGDNKKLRQESPDSVVDDLNYLKDSIKQEIFKTFEERFSKLENEIHQLKYKQANSSSSATVKAKDSVSTPPDEVKVSTGGPRLHPLNPSSAGIQKSQTSNPFNDSKAFELKDKTSASLKPSTHTFGGSSFKITTPMNSFMSNVNPADTPTAPNTAQSSPKHVFGATSMFGNTSAFDSVKEKKNVFESLPSKSESSKSPNDIPQSNSSSATSSFGGTFGGNSKFNNAFQNSLKKKSFLDEKPTKDNDQEEEANAEDEDEKSPATQQYKQVDLRPVDEIKTGEENEKSHFTYAAKMFELDLSKISEGWKERGLGKLHLNQSLDDPRKVRLIMRSQGLLRVVLNMKVTKETKLIKGLEASLSPGKFVRLNSVNDKGAPVQYLLKFGNQTIRDELVEKVEDLKKSFDSNSDTTNNGLTSNENAKDAKGTSTGVKWL